MKKLIRASQILFATVVICAVTISISNNVSADSLDKSSLTKKALLNSLDKCTASNNWNQNVTSTGISPYKGNSINNAVKSLLSNNLVNDGYSNKINLPTGFSGSDIVSCADAFETLAKTKNPFPANLTDSEEIKKLTDNFKYTPVENGTTISSTQCLSFEYRYKSSASSPTQGYTTNTICFSVDQDGNIVDTQVTDDSNADGPLKIAYTTTDDTSYQLELTCDAKCEPGVDGQRTYTGASHSVVNSTSINTLADELTNLQGNITTVEGTDGWYSSFQPVTPVVKDESANGGSATAFEFSGNLTTDDLIRAFSDYGTSAYGTGSYGSAYSAAAFNDDEKYTIYKTYLKEVFNASINTSECTEDKGTDNDRIKVKTESGAQWCRVEVGGINSSIRVNGFKDNDNHHLDQKMGLSEVLAALNSDDLNPSDEALSTASAEGVLDETAAGESTTATDEEGEEDATPNCWNSAESLGWIVCPIISGIQSAIDFLYQNFIEPSLQVRAEMFSDTTRSAWQIFQTAANIIFVILLLIVIISQVTGVGIDNYGIKRILPRLVVVAILVNISYFLCALAVDISNILGQAMYNLFNNMAETSISANPTIDTAVAASSSIISLTITLIFATGGLLALGGALGVILTLLPSMLVAFVSILFMFILLSVRQAGIVILSVISPIAVALYMLPNTKKYFDKWVKMYSGLLMLYPICGAIIGGSNFASVLLLSVNSNGSTIDPFFTLSAMLVNVVPYFFIPTLLRNSFSAMGNLGNRIGNVGKRFGNISSKALAKSQTYRQRLAMQRGNLRRGADGKLELKDNWRSRVAKGTGKLPHERLISSIAGRAVMRSSSNNIEEALKLEDNTRKAANFTNQRFITGQDEKNAFGSEQQLRDAETWASEGYADGRRQKAILADESGRLDIANYNDQNFVLGRRNQAHVETAKARDQALYMSDAQNVSNVMTMHALGTQKERVRVQRFGSQDTVDAAIASIEEEQQKTNIANEAAKLRRSGVMDRGDFSNGGEIERALLDYSRMENGEFVNADGLSAIVNALSETDDGREVVRRVLESNQVNDAQRDKIALNIRNNLPSWKPGDPAMLKWAQEAETKSLSTLNEFSFGNRPALSKKISQKTFTGMDKSQYQRIIMAVTGDENQQGSLLHHMKAEQDRIEAESYTGRNLTAAQIRADKDQRKEAVKKEHYAAINAWKDSAEKALKSYNEGRNSELNTQQVDFLRALRPKEKAGKQNNSPQGGSGQPQNPGGTGGNQNTGGNDGDGQPQNPGGTGDNQNTGGNDGSGQPQNPDEVRGNQDPTVTNSNSQPQGPSVTNSGSQSQNASSSNSGTISGTGDSIVNIIGTGGGNTAGGAPNGITQSIDGQLDSTSQPPNIRTTVVQQPAGNTATSQQVQQGARMNVNNVIQARDSGGESSLSQPEPDEHTIVQPGQPTSIRQTPVADRPSAIQSALNRFNSDSAVSRVVNIPANGPRTDDYQRRVDFNENAAPAYDMPLPSINGANQPQQTGQQNTQTQQTDQSDQNGIAQGNGANNPDNPVQDDNNTTAQNNRRTQDAESIARARSGTVVTQEQNLMDRQRLFDEFYQNLSNPAPLPSSSNTVPSQGGRTTGGSFFPGGTRMAAGNGGVPGRQTGDDAGFNMPTTDSVRGEGGNSTAGG